MVSSGVRSKIHTCVLLAAGRGKRLGELTAHTPKPLLEVGGAPIIAHIIDGIACAGISHFIVVIGFLGEQIHARDSSAVLGARA
ncbi:MAG: nucleotidyltransferase family protein [Candidatus Binataceae bacterium]